MTECGEDKSHNYNRSISNLERFSWNALLDILQVHDLFQHKGDLVLMGQPIIRLGKTLN